MKSEVKRNWGVRIGSVNGRLEGDRNKVRFEQTNMARLLLASQIERSGADFAVMSGGEFVTLSVQVISLIKMCSRFNPLVIRWFTLI